ncbi:MAG: hypothetical protein Q8L14_19435 [Myxococcales bacterium]|nr:hypothetical protein [Myxococcales bacterium]
MPTFDVRPEWTGTTALVAALPFLLTYRVAGFLDCESGRREIERITVEVIDDSGQPLAHIVGSNSDPFSDPSGRMLNVFFTPAAPGSVVVRLVAEPSIGVRQHALTVYQETPRPWSDTGLDCDGLLERPDGGGVCVKGTRVEFSTPTGIVQKSFSTAVVTDSMLWVFSSDGVEAWRFDGQQATPAFTRTETFPSSSAPILATHGSQVAVSSFEGLTLYDEDGGLRELVRGPRGRAQALRFLDASTLLLARGRRTERLALDDLDASVVLDTDPMDSMPVLAGEDGFWRLDAVRNQVTLERPDGRVVEGQAPRASLAPTRSLPDLVPLFRLGSTGLEVTLVGLTVAMPDAGVTIEGVRLPRGVDATWLSSRWLYARRDGSLIRTPRVP